MDLHFACPSKSLLSPSILGLRTEAIDDISKVDDEVAANACYLMHYI
jgi:hypothetical protein